MSEGLMENGELIVENGGSAWREVKIGEFCTITRGGSPRPIQDFITKTGTPWVKIADAKKDSRYIRSTKEFIKEEGEKKSRIVYPGDFILSNSATPGLPRFMKIRACIHDGWLLLREINGVDEVFLYYLLLTEREALLIQGNGSIFTNLKTDVLRYHTVKLPPLPEQKAIAEVLSALDDKIDLLHRQNKTLEQMAETLFRQWFVVEAGEDWVEYKVSDIANHIKENVKPASNPLLTYRHYSLPAFDNGKHPVIEIGKEILSNKYVVPPQTILVSKLNPRVPRIWAIPDKVAEKSICSTEFQVFQPKKELYYGFLCFLFKSDEAVGELEMAASGTSGSHQRVKPQDILNIIFLVPSLDKIEEYSQEVKPLIEKQQRNNDYIRTLQSLRDTLLPKLMSGEVRVNFKEAVK